MNDEEVLRRWNLHRERRSDDRMLLWSWLGFQEALSRYLQPASSRHSPVN